MGNYLKSAFPSSYYYYALGMGSATESYAATTDVFDTRYNVMKPYSLDKPIKDSWESYSTKMHPYPFFIFGGAMKQLQEECPLRFIGYRPESGKLSYRCGWSYHACFYC